MTTTQVLTIHREDPRFSAHTIWKEKDAPSVLYAEGDNAGFSLLMNRLPERGLAIVGTRRPTARSVSRLRGWISDLRGSDLVIVSGFARGIDAVAHESAIAAGLPTIAIFGTGLDMTYPPQHVALRESILAAHGLIISEFPPAFDFKPMHFLRRNRLIAGFSSAVWVVEAPARSGALNTAQWAADMGKTIFTTPCFPNDPPLEGNQKLLEKSDAVAFWSPRDLDHVWSEFAGWDKKRRMRAKAGPDERNLIRAAGALGGPRGGASVQDLLDWSIGQGWIPQRFFDTLEKCLDARLLLDENGLVLKNVSISD